MAYHGGFGGGMNMNALMQQAKKMQEQMQKAQEELDQAEVVGKAGGEMVVVTMNGKKELNVHQCRICYTCIISNLMCLINN